MVRKAISKSKRKSKMKHRVSRVKRPTTRRRNKKTRKRYKGGSAETPPVGLTRPGKGRVEDVVEDVDVDVDVSLPSPNLFDGPRSVDVLREIYGGDPEEINTQLIKYSEQIDKLNDHRLDLILEKKLMLEKEETEGTEGTVKIGKIETRIVEADQKMKELVKANMTIAPKYILISGHGAVLDCIDRTATPCFTLLPRGYNLILSTATGVNLIEEGDGVYTTQQDPTYFRMYGGLIPNHYIDFHFLLGGGRVFYPWGVGAEIRLREELAAMSKGVLIARAMDVGADVSAVLKNAPNADLDEFKKDVIDRILLRESVIAARYPGVKLRAVQPFEPDEPDTDKYFKNFVSERLDIPLSYSKTVMGLEKDVDKIRNYAQGFVSFGHRHVFPMELVIRQIRNSVTPGYEGEFDRFTLSQLLKHIEDEGKKRTDLPKNILGEFCRGGEFNYNIDGLIEVPGKYGLPQLTQEYFSGNIDYGVDPGLTKQYSLASKTKPQDFWSIYDNLKKKIDKFGEAVREWFGSIIRKIEVESEEELSEPRLASGRLPRWAGPYPMRGINLTLDDVSLIFQMDYYLES
jgi:hypothetical protein